MGFAKWLRAAVWTLAVALTTVGAPARADDGWEERLAQLGEYLSRGGLDFAMQNLEDERVSEVLAAHPAGLRKVCAGAEAGRSMLLASDATKAKALAANLVDASRACVEANPGNADALWAHASARLVRGRMERDGNGKPDPADWTEAAATLEKAWAASAEGGLPVAEAAAALLEASKLPGADAAALTASADSLLDRGLEKHPDSGALFRAWAVRTMDRVNAALAVKKADAVALLDAAMKRIAPRVQKKDPDVDMATAWNDFVAFNVDKKLGLKVDFVTRTVRALGALTLKIPVSRRWVADEESSSSPITQLSTSNEPIRTITFDSYQWDTAYGSGKTEAGGDNLKGVANVAMQDVRLEMAKVKSFKEIAKGRLNSKLSQCVWWEMVATPAKSSKEQRIRAWAFKSDEGRMQTYVIYVFDWDLSDFDAAARAVMDSIEEIPKK